MKKLEKTDWQYMAAMAREYASKMQSKEDTDEESGNYIYAIVDEYDRNASYELLRLYESEGVEAVDIHTFQGGYQTITVKYTDGYEICFDTEGRCDSMDDMICHEIYAYVTGRIDENIQHLPCNKNVHCKKKVIHINESELREMIKKSVCKILNEEKYDKRGFGLESGRHRDTGTNRDPEGYNKLGLDRYGFDRNGYGLAGWGRDGFNKKGWGRDGFNKKGWDKDGYNRSGFNKEGFNRDGLDKYGYNKEESYYYHLFKNELSHDSPNEGAVYSIERENNIQAICCYIEDRSEFKPLSPEMDDESYEWEKMMEWAEANGRTYFDIPCQSVIGMGAEHISPYPVATDSSHKTFQHIDAKGNPVGPKYIAATPDNGNENIMMGEDGKTMYIHAWWNHDKWFMRYEAKQPYPDGILIGYGTGLGVYSPLTHKFGIPTTDWLDKDALFFPSKNKKWAILVIK